MIASTKLKIICIWKESYDNPRKLIKMQRHHFAHKDPFTQQYFFFCLVMYGFESWTIKKAEHQELMLLKGGAGEHS